MSLRLVAADIRSVTQKQIKAMQISSEGLCTVNTNTKQRKRTNQPSSNKIENIKNSRLQTGWATNILRQQVTLFTFLLVISYYVKCKFTHYIM